MAPQLKFTYFDGPGRGELSRLAFVAGGVQFDDHRIAGAAFGELKPTLPLGQLPVLEVDGTTYPQSLAIARYAAQLSGLQPASPLDALNVDVVLETLVDVRAVTSDIRYREKDETVKAEKTKKFREEGLPKAFGLLDKAVRGKFVLGDALSLADLALFDFVENTLKPTLPDLDVAAYPKIAAVIENVRAHERIAAYLASRAK